jgi:hypothetical protein
MSGLITSKPLVVEPNFQCFDAWNTLIDQSWKIMSIAFRDERLLAARRPKKGARTLLLELLEVVHRNDLDTATVGNVNAHWRTVAKWT